MGPMKVGMIAKTMEKEQRAKGTRPRRSEKVDLVKAGVDSKEAEIKDSQEVRF